MNGWLFGGERVPVESGAGREAGSGKKRLGAMRLQSERESKLNAEAHFSGREASGAAGGVWMKGTIHLNDMVIG